MHMFMLEQKKESTHDDALIAGTVKEAIRNWNASADLDLTGVELKFSCGCRADPQG